MSHRRETNHDIETRLATGDVDARALHEIAATVEREWRMGGLSEGLYFAFACEVAERFYQAKSRVVQEEE